MTTIVEDVKLDFSDVLLMPKRSALGSRAEVDLKRTLRFKHSPCEYTGVPVVVANMDTVGTIEMAKALKPFNMSVALHKFYDQDTLTQYFLSDDYNPHTFFTIGTNEDDYRKFRMVELDLNAEKRRINYLCIDIANGYSRQLVKMVERVRNDYPSLVIMAGNVVTGDMVYDLLERGADIVKVGIGPGSVCTTRRMTGVGYPQLSAILECQDAAHGAGGLICGDGGVAVPGDLSKAFAAGSDFVMCGGIFAGHTECNGEVINIVHESHSADGTAGGVTTTAKMRYYGMSSGEAMDKHYGGKAKYRASEGKVVEVPYKGPVAATVEEMLGGLRSACTYIGARRLKDMPKCATFVKVNRQLNTVFGDV